MDIPAIKINLSPSFFSEKERLLVEHSSLSASAFRYDSGVCALRLRNELGELVMLPFQGQQIWSAFFRGRDLTMKSMFDDPHNTRVYLENYGGFLIHCGAAAMGVPTKDDTHPLHGELPNAPYQVAFLQLGQDEKGQYIALGGRYQHTVAFSHNYLAEPLVKLYIGSSLFTVTLTISNLKRSEMELMYLAHVNFKPVDDSLLVYSAEYTSQSVRVRKSIPSHVHPKPDYAEFLQSLRSDPAQHHRLSPSLLFDPEVVFFIDYLTDQDGWAHSLQVLPDGNADYVRHKPSQLDKGVRWICRTVDQDALGLVLPATAEPEGYTAEKAKGNLKVLPPGGKFYCEMEMGCLDPDETTQVIKKISAIKGLS